jgi:hypothetical protein
MKTLMLHVQNEALDRVLELLKTIPQDQYKIEELDDAQDFERELAALEHATDFSDEEQASRYFTFLRKGKRPTWRQEYLDEFFKNVPEYGQYGQYSHSGTV